MSTKGQAKAMLPNATQIPKYLSLFSITFKIVQKQAFDTLTAMKGHLTDRDLISSDLTLTESIPVMGTPNTY